MDNKVIAIVGPTASGKSDWAVEIARRFNGEVISADSRQVYRGLNIGSGKITRREQKGVPHHMLDIASPRRVFTVAQYQKKGRKVLKDILHRGKLPIIAGGTGLYVDALLYNTVFPEVKPNMKLRTKLSKESTATLFAQLQKFDPIRAETIDPHNKVRLIRALEIVLATGEPVPLLRNQKKQFDVLMVGISVKNDELKWKIHTRLVARLRKGMIAEVQRLHKNGISWQRLESLGLEYRWVSRSARGLITRSEMIISLEQEINQYARRQMTWFKRDKEIRWVNDEKEAMGATKKFLET